MYVQHAVYKMNVAKRMKFKITQIVCENFEERICRTFMFKKRDKLQNM